MKDFYIKESPKTPRIKFVIETGVCEISGRSIPENSIALYQPFMNWLEEYVLQKPQPKVKIIAKLEYFNTSSSKYLAEIFKKFETIYKPEKENIELQWYYEEDDEPMIESGEDFQQLVKYPVKVLQLET